MKNTGNRNLKSTSLLRDDAVRHYILLLSLLGVLVVCGCNKTPPADNTASSTPAAAPAATTAPTPDQTPAPAANAPAPAAPAPAPAPAQAAAPDIEKLVRP
jgi:cell division septation protein DedD